ncbi:oxidoreductase [Nocardiopsis ansamitocini]|uniref:Oxidoreductase n=1 Tax=Nocardiopsis ansamitocini TaxID=1670832 RepID=A0A9W6PA93_9ACTN|nr:oxidoreductase [Nocardiopsis ansamitocini]
MAAALDLTSAGLDVLVLEASDGVGGRMRTDLVDGYRIDRGFQVLNTAYPALRRYLDLEALELRTFPKGVAVRSDRGLHRLSASASGALSALAFLAGPAVGTHDALRLLRMTARNAAAPAARLKARPETTALEELRAQGLSERTVRSLVAPFLSGVFLEDSLSTSSRFADLVWRSFVLGRVTVPAKGMGTIPEQMAARLETGRIRLGAAVRQVRGNNVLTDDGEVRAEAVIVATGPVQAAQLLPSLLPEPQVNAVTTYYHSRPAGKGEEALLHVDGRVMRRGPRIANSVVLTATAPSYAPDGRSLIATSVLGTGRLTEAQVRTETAAVHGTSASDWELVREVRVPEALPSAPPPLGDLRRPVALADGLYVAGDHRDTPSIQGALASGSRAAKAVIGALVGASSRS